MILERLRAIGGGIYVVGHRVLDTAEHGLPQHRETCVHHRHPQTEFAPQRQARISLAPACRVPPACPPAGPLPVGSDVREAERNFLATCSPGQKKRLLQAFVQVEPGWTATAMKSSLSWTWMAPRLAGRATYLRA